MKTIQGYKEFINSKLQEIEKKNQEIKSISLEISKSFPEMKSAMEDILVKIKDIVDLYSSDLNYYEIKLVDPYGDDIIKLTEDEKIDISYGEEFGLGLELGEFNEFSIWIDMGPYNGKVFKSIANRIISEFGDDLKVGTIDNDGIELNFK